jgi:hypothetical protein
MHRSATDTLTQWQNGRRGQDGWGRWTRRRKWYRDAELVEMDSEDETEEAKEPPNEPPQGTSPTQTLETRPSFPPQPRTPTLAPPITTFSPNNETMSMPDLHRKRTNDSLKEIKEEDVSSPDRDNKEKEKDDTSSVLSTSSRSMRLLPSLRRRVTDNTAANKQQHHRRDDSVTSSPRSAVVSPYSVGGGSAGPARHTSEVQSEDEQASLGPGLGLEISKDRRIGSWGMGDEAVMGLE